MTLRTATLLALALPAAAFAQYEGPALEACRALAERDANHNAVAEVKVVIDRDRHLLIDELEAKLGSQRLRAVLTGRGAIVYPTSASAELAFACLLADEKRPLLFYWLPHQEVSPLKQCTRAKAMAPNAEACLTHLAEVAETDLLQPAALRFQETLERDAATNSEKASDTYRKAAEAWRAYRDAECTRRQEAAGGDKLVRLSCVAELTRQRRHDLRGTP